MTTRAKLPTVLADGSYDALVVDADGDGDADLIVLSLVVSAGPSKGEVVDVRAMHLHLEPIELLAVPCILVVRDGTPTVIFD